MSELLERAQALLERAHGGEEMEVFISRGVETEIQAYQGEVENLSSSSSAEIGIRILIDGPQGARVGSAYAGSLDEEAIVEAITNARDNARYATEDEFVAFARPDGVSAVTLSLSDPRVSTTSMDEKVALAIELEAMVRGGDQRIRQVDSANYSDYVADAAIVTTTGIAATLERSGAYVSVEAIASEGDEDQTGWGLSVGRAPGDLSLEKASSDAIRRATRMLGAVKAPSSKGIAVFDPRTAATLWSLMGSALSGDAVVRGRSFFAGRLGELVASPLVTLIDDPTDPRHFAASPFDSEGLASRRNELITEGQLQRFVYDTVSGRRAGTASTGNAVRGGVSGSPSAGCRALQLVPGEYDQDEIFRRVGNGVFVESLTGVHSGVNPISGDFSVGITGLMIRDGVLAEPIREVTIASTLQRMLLDVVYVGNDVEWLPGTTAAQTLAIDAISLSGS
ncbi:MAG: TldD/PmbA family protein [Actinomycetota bacterium]|nr:TldD/PmbA family protein [Actinomycetota bacterium]